MQGDRRQPTLTASRHPPRDKPAINAKGVSAGKVEVQTEGAMLAICRAETRGHGSRFLRGSRWKITHAGRP